MNNSPGEMLVDRP